MARKGELAKDNATAIIAKAFGDNFLGIQDKKIFVEVQDEGEKVQLAISLTMPKAGFSGKSEPVPTSSTVGAAPWEVNNEPVPRASVKMSAEEEARVDELCKKLGIEF